MMAYQHRAQNILKERPRPPEEFSSSSQQSHRFPFSPPPETSRAIQPPNPKQWLLVPSPSRPPCLALLSQARSPSPPLVLPRQGGCAPTASNDVYADQPLITEVGFYSDMNCNDRIGGSCLYVPQVFIDGGPGSYGCAPPSLPDAPFYFKVDSSEFSALQVLFTRDQSCPPDGPGAVYITLVDNQSCVQSNLGGDAPGVSVYPNGGAGITREQQREAEITVVSTDEKGQRTTGTSVVQRDPESSIVERLAKTPIINRQSNTRCNGFRADDAGTPSQSRTVQISNIIDCTNGGDAGCDIGVEEQESMSISTSYSLSAGGGIEGESSSIERKLYLPIDNFSGIFSVEATFGMEFTQEVSTSVQNGFNVNAGQRGYIGAYNGATLFNGVFTDCESGDAEQAGSTLALRKNQIFYSIILTGASRNGTFEEE